MKTLQGIGASPGSAAGPTFLFQQEDLSYRAMIVAAPQQEWERMQAAFHTALDQLKQVYEKARQEAGEAQAAIFEAHMQMLQDPELIDLVRQSILASHENAEKALMDAAEHYARTLEELPDEYFRARAGCARRGPALPADSPS